MCRRGKVAPIPLATAILRPAPMLPSNWNAPNVEQVCLRRLVAWHEGSFSEDVNCVPGTRATILALRGPLQPPRRLQQTDRCAPQGKRTNCAAHTTTQTPRIGSTYLLARQLSDALEVPGEDGGARRPCIQKNADIGH